MSTRTIPLHWAALLAAHELDPGHWHMHVDEAEPPYACIRLLTVEHHGEPVRRYRAVTWKPASEDRRLIGYEATLRAACEHARAHHAHEVRYGDPWMGNAAEATAYGLGAPRA